MFEPKFIITQQILKNIGTIEGAKEVIERAALVPMYEADFRREALIRTVHFGTKLEGNDLSLTEAERVIEGPSFASATSRRLPIRPFRDSDATAGERDRNVQEVINYREVMAYLDRLKEKADKKEEWRYSEGQLKKIHRLTVARILPENQGGEYRRTQVVVRNLRTQEISFRPPPAVEVSYQVEDFLSWLNSVRGREVHPVLRAGITHYELARIHPFVDGNGRAARAYTLLVLFLEGYEVKKFFSLEEYYDRYPKNYYEALQSVEKMGGNETVWLEFFVEGLKQELVRIKEQVIKLSAQVQSLPQQIALTNRQIQILEAMKARGGQITTKEAKEVVRMVSGDTIIRDLNDLIKKEVVKKQGSTKASKYILVGE
ncbi:MAG: Fic family protein [Candidatus Chisholmbacteria bacterium]|nr:Fic family protein [Candidatus Chisholmbacteria bacterium]